MTQQFHLGDILSVTTGCLLSPRHMEGFYDILNYMTGESLFTHQLPRARRVCGPALLRQHPQLGAVHFKEADKHRVDTWLVEQVEIFGEMLSVEPLPAGEGAEQQEEQHA